MLWSCAGPTQYRHEAVLFLVGPLYTNNSIPQKQYFFLTHWCRDNMDAISQTIFWNSFSWMKMFQLRLKFDWSLFPRVHLTIFQHWFRWWLGAVHATSHYLNQWWSVYQRIYESLGLNELNRAYLNMTIKCGLLCYIRKVWLFLTAWPSSKTRESEETFVIFTVTLLLEI